jgi:sec-independent protein translocase protein TatA
MGLLAMFDILGPSGILLAVLAVLLYGERLPEVAKTFGKQYLDFKKGIHSLREEFETVATGVRSHGENGRSSSASEADHDREEPTAPKFEPPPPEPDKDAS